MATTEEKKNVLDIGITLDESEVAQLSFPLKAYREAWKALKEGRGPLRILICGKGGAGKSALVNNLFELNGEDKADENMVGGPTTKECWLYRRTTKFGDTIFMFDSPGFGDLKMSNEDVIAKMTSVTQKNVDVILYCISVNPGACRVDKEDSRAFDIINRSFSKKIWKKAVVVLTFANKLQKKLKSTSEEDKFNTIIDNIVKDVHLILQRELFLDKSMTDTIPIKMAGHHDIHLPFSKPHEDWRDTVFISALKRVLTEKIPALFETRYSFENVVERIYEAALNAGEEFTSGSAIENIVLEILSPVILGPVIEPDMERSTKMTKILTIKLKVWQSLFHMLA